MGETGTQQAYTRAEHEEFRRTVDVHIQKLEDEDHRLHERLKAVEQMGEQISAMNVTLQKQSDNISKLSENIANLVSVQEKDSKRLKELEDRDGEMWRKAVGYVATTIIGIVIGFVFTMIGM